MKKVAAILGLAALVAAENFALAGKPPGLAKKGKVPPGFSHGKKTGWQNEYPPGWDQKSEKEKQNWKKRIQKGRGKISKAARDKGMSMEDAEALADDFEKAARKGLDPVEAESIVKDRMEKRSKGKDLSAATTENTDKRLKAKAGKEKKEKYRSKGKGKKK